MTRSTWIPFIVGLVAAACGGSGSTDVTPDQACTDAATTLCNKIDSCSPLFIQLQYGDAATCIARAKLSCTQNLATPGTSDTPAFIEGCGNAYGSLSCADVFGIAANPPAACQAAPGTVANGGACGVNDQCQSTACKIDGTTGCGTCAVRANSGESCANGVPCAVGLTCAGNQTCVTPGALNDACDAASKPCKGGLVCDGGTCKTPQPAGAPCTGAGTGNCDGTQGLYCSNSQCKQALTAKAGQTCGIDLQAGTYTACTGGSVCTSNNVCSAVAADGAACDDTKGPTCLAPARCMSGICTVVNPASCK